MIMPHTYKESAATPLTATSPMIKFILLSTQRSGTNFTVQWLNSHPQVRCHFELFLRKHRRQDGFYPYCDHHPLRWAWFNLYKKIRRYQYSALMIKPLLKQFLDTLYQPGYPGPERLFAGTHYAFQSRDPHQEKAVGFKLMYDHIEYFPTLINLIKNERIHVLHLIRKNKLKIVLSNCARKLRATLTPAAALLPLKFAVDTSTLLTKLQRQNDNENKMRVLFSDNPYLEITYEDFFANHDQTARMIENFLNVTNDGWCWPSLQKLNPNSVKEILANYAEVTTLLKNTAFEKYLD